MSATDRWKDEEISAVLYDHIWQLRQVPEYANAIIIPFVEKNYGGNPMASRICDMVCRPALGAVLPYQEIEHNQVRPGFYMTEAFKQAATQALADVLRDRALFVAKHFVSNIDPVENLAELERQLRDFRLEQTEDDGDPFKKPRFVLSGKRAGPDDRAITLAQNIEWTLRRLRDPKLIRLCRERGWRTGVV